ncbi:hypothetical protein ACFQFC_13560 [Amorphoplanes digitatis]|uniref:Uncharacterized protein n=1 Tax=Actinoplanes digitatis TaxID=1868 RepID=A0A7W7MT49_9ACTN|nr:hypothetical protein [Actinoplanes digitatis]MBB4765229.1 hypothetical protein [Actinoplanes digitatis]BFE74990.1 hypothetical protein GCM10020092_082910 [Actinoplanes digitatis]GID94681.1 hypothetical protein Adi01nite_40930 [Actinoplanes digitatis]
MRDRHEAGAVGTLAVGDRVTVQTANFDPVELTVHSHAVVTDIEDDPGGPRYLVGHPPADRRYGPYPAARLTRGWEAGR